MRQQPDSGCFRAGGGHRLSAVFIAALVLAPLCPGLVLASGVPFAPPSVISTDTSQVYSVFAADVDGDGDIDVLSASLQDNMIAWYENDGASPPAWTARDIAACVQRPARDC